MESDIIERVRDFLANYKDNWFEDLQVRWFDDPIGELI